MIEELLTCKAHYRRIFGETHDLPLPCFYCGEPITVATGRSTPALTVHHVNGDHHDDRIENLAGSHKGCHNTIHLKGVPFTEDHKKRIASALRGNGKSAEHREAMSRAQTYRKFKEYS